MNTLLFTTENLELTVKGLKTVTRRVIKPLPIMEHVLWRWQPKKGVDINLTNHHDLAIAFAKYHAGEIVFLSETWHEARRMPAWAARHFVRILEVRAERLQDITFQDCLAEGIVETKYWKGLEYIAPAPQHPEDLSNEECDREIDRGWDAYARQAYLAEWDAIYGKPQQGRFHSSCNPWVFKYRYELCNREGSVVSNALSCEVEYGRLAG